MRTYGEVIAIRIDRGSGSHPVPVPGQISDVMVAGSQFLWRSRIYVIRSVLAHWIESGTWWTSRHQHIHKPTVDLDHQRSITRDVGATERWVWRVEAAAGSSASIGVYDLACEIDVITTARHSQAQWRLARALD